MQKKEEQIIVGVDEAGRGPLAGPVFAAAVILNPAKPIMGLADSKTLTAKERERLYQQIREYALAFAAAQASVEEIDKINILQASLLAMQRAVRGLKIKPHLALIDGNICPKLPCKTQALIKGDALEPAISAASIVAKVLRDRHMIKLHQQFPKYGFAEHKGYATPKHLAALRQHGPCESHRRSFAHVTLKEESVYVMGDV